MGFDRRVIARWRTAVSLAQSHRSQLRFAVAESLELSMFVRRHEGTAHMDLAVEGIGCAGCIRKIEGGMKRLPGVVEARLNFTNRRLTGDWDEEGLAAVSVGGGRGGTGVTPV